MKKTYIKVKIASDKIETKQSNMYSMRKDKGHSIGDIRQKEQKKQQR